VLAKLISLEMHSCTCNVSQTTTSLKITQTDVSYASFIACNKDERKYFSFAIQLETKHNNK